MLYTSMVGILFVLWFANLIIARSVMKRFQFENEYYTRILQNGSAIVWYLAGIVGIAVAQHLWAFASWPILIIFSIFGLFQLVPVVASFISMVSLHFTQPDIVRSPEVKNMSFGNWITLLSNFLTLLGNVMLILVTIHMFFVPLISIPAQMVNHSASSTPVTATATPSPTIEPALVINKTIFSLMGKTRSVVDAELGSSEYKPYFGGYWQYASENVGVGFDSRDADGNPYSISKVTSLHAPASSIFKNDPKHITRTDMETVFGRSDLHYNESSLFGEHIYTLTFKFRGYNISVTCDDNGDVQSNETFWIKQ